MTKDHLRKKYRQIRRTLLQSKGEIIEDQITNNLIKIIGSKRAVALFYPKSDEISLLELAKKFPQKIFLLPRLRGDGRVMDFCESDLDKENLVLHQKYKILEPSIDSKALLPDIILVPLLAFDKRRNRLGYGGGYYDATIAYLESINHDFITIGVAHTDMKVEGDLPLYNTDKSLDYIVTEDGVV